MKKISLLGLGFVLLLVIVPTNISLAISAKNVTSPYLFNFNTNGSLPESGASNTSWSPYWWVNSGAYLKMVDGKGSTVLGSLPVSDPWRVLYAANNPTDTDNGYHPQNIFRLLSRSKWGDARQEAYFVIDRDNLSASS